jgi:hypothetical protein
MGSGIPAPLEVAFDYGSVTVSETPKHYSNAKNIGRISYPDSRDRLFASLKTFSRLWAARVMSDSAFDSCSVNALASPSMMVEFILDASACRLPAESVVLSHTQN